MTSPNQPLPSMRLDKWLWAARLYKTRSLAVADIVHGRVTVNEQSVKAARDLRVGDIVSLRSRDQAPPRSLAVRGLSSARGPAPVAQLLYEETADSLAARTRWLATRAYAVDPGATIEAGRPTKQARRQLDEHQQAAWNRWSASIDDT